MIDPKTFKNVFMGDFSIESSFISAWLLVSPLLHGMPASVSQTAHANGKDLADCNKA